MTGKCFGLLRFSLLGVAAAVLGACSPGLLSGDASKVPDYRPINTSCDIHSPSKNLDVPTLRALVHCFNAYGGLAPVDEMVSELSDSDLQPVVDSLSNYILKQPQMLYELDHTYQSLDSEGKLQDDFTTAGNFLSNDQFVVSLLQIAKEAYYPSSGGAIQRIFSSPKPDPEFLAALSYLSQKLTPDNVGTGIDVGLTLAGAPAFKGIQLKFRGSSPSGRPLRQLTDAALSYVQSSGPSAVPVGELALQGLVREDLFQAFDDAIGGSTPDLLKKGIDRLSSVFRESFAGQGDIFEGLTSLLGALHAPIHCMKGTQEVADADMWFLGEVSRQNTSDSAAYIRITHPLTEIAVNPVCDIPPQIGQYYPYVVQLAQSTAVEPAVDLMKAFYRQVVTNPIDGSTRPLAEFFIKMMSEESISKVTPVMTELNDRKVWDDLLLLATLPREEDRDSIANAVKFITDPIPGLSAPTSIYEVLLKSLRSADPSDFYQLVSSLGNYVDLDEPLTQEFLQDARDSYYVNDVHPMQQLLQEILHDAPKNAGLFATLFKAVDSPEFQDSVKLMSQMATDGRLKDLTETTLKIFRPIAQTGQVPISPVDEPVFVPKSRHNLDEKDLVPYALSTQPVDPNDPCSHLDTRFFFDQFDAPGYDQNLTYTTECLARAPADKPLLDAINYLRSEKTENGWDYFRLPIELVKEWNPAPEELSYLSNAWLRSYDSGYFLNLLDTVPFMVDRTISPTPGGPSFDAGAVLRPLFDLAGPLMSQEGRPKFQLIENVAATQLRRPDFPKTLKVANDLLSKKPEPTPVPVITQFDRARIDRWVGNKECERPESQNEEFRTSQILDDFNNSIDSWSLQNGEPRRTYSIDDVKKILGNTLKKLADPSLNATDESLEDAILNVMRYFTLTEGQPENPQQHFTPDYLLQWLKDRSEDYRLITYYYQDENGNYEDKPRVRLVNSLDRLELVLVDADFQARILGLPIVGNSSLQYTAELALAWGDEPRELWPDKIKAMFPPGKSPKKLKDAVQDMFNALGMYQDLVGFPSPPKCRQTADPNDPPDVQKAETSWPTNHTGTHLPDAGMFRNIERSLFNLNQVMSVLEENTPLNPGENPQTRPNAGGLKVLRDMMYEFYMSTPPEYRSYNLDPKIEWRNNLKVQDDLARLGIFRALGRVLRQFDGNEKELHDAFRTMMMSSLLPETRHFLDALFVHDPNQQVFWTVLEKIFGVFDSAQAPATQQVHLQQVQQLARMKQLGFYSLALGDPTKLTGPVMEAAATLIDKYPDLILKHPDEVDEMLRSAEASYATRAFYELPNPADQALITQVLNAALQPQVADSALSLIDMIENDPTSHDAWELFGDRKDALFALPEFQPYRQYFDRFSTDLIDFFSDQMADPNAQQAANHSRLFVADMLQNQEIDQFLLLAKKDPNKSYQLLQTISKYVENGELQQFFDLIRRSLSQPSR